MAKLKRMKVKGSVIEYEEVDPASVAKPKTREALDRLTDLAEGRKTKPPEVVEVVQAPEQKPEELKTEQNGEQNDPVL
jgi:hypothetical protein